MCPFPAASDQRTADTSPRPIRAVTSVISAGTFSRTVPLSTNIALVQYWLLHQLYQRARSHGRCLCLPTLPSSNTGCHTSYISGHVLTDGASVYQHCPRPILAVTSVISVGTFSRTVPLSTSIALVQYWLLHQLYQRARSHGGASVYQHCHRPILAVTPVISAGTFSRTVPLSTNIALVQYWLLHQLYQWARSHGRCLCLPTLPSSNTGYYISYISGHVLTDGASVYQHCPRPILAVTSVISAGTFSRTVPLSTNIALVQYWLLHQLYQRARSHGRCLCLPTLPSSNTGYYISYISGHVLTDGASVYQHCPRPILAVKSVISAGTFSRTVPLSTNIALVQYWLLHQLYQRARSHGRCLCLPTLPSSNTGCYISYISGHVLTDGASVYQHCSRPILAVTSVISAGTFSRRGLCLPTLPSSNTGCYISYISGHVLTDGASVYQHCPRPILAVTSVISAGTFSRTVPLSTNIALVQYWLLHQLYQRARSHGRCLCLPTLPSSNTGCYISYISGHVLTDGASVYQHYSPQSQIFPLALQPYTKYIPYFWVGPLLLQLCDCSGCLFGIGYTVWTVGM